MNAEEIIDLYRFNEWANKKFIDAIQKLDEEKYVMEIKSSFPSIRSTISHIIGSEWIWLQRWIGKKPNAPPDWYNTPSINTLSEKLNEIESERQKFLSGLNDQDLGKLLYYTLLSGKAQQNTLQETLLHAINHSTYHRGQLATLFRQVNETPPSTDLITYYREKIGNG